MRGAEELAGILRRIDRRGYKAYRELRGAFELDGLVLFVDHVQADPFAAPSRLRLRLPGKRAGIPPALTTGRARRTALEDYLARRVRAEIARIGARPRGSGRSGRLSIDAGGQEVLPRTAVRVTGNFVEARIEAGLPAAGRSVLGREAEELLLGVLPRIAEAALRAAHFPPGEAERFVRTVEAQEEIRARLPELGLVAFLADGSVLPRESGASDRVLRGADVRPLRSPEALRVEIGLEAPVPGPEGERTRLVGLGLPEGVTLVVGGGYHGKSTLLRAVERGIYPHIPGDGREWVVTRADAVKIRAEDGRRVEAVDISGFIDDLPQGRSTRAFASDDASGSTSQAANICEALEAGSRLLLLDEDTSATNFMVRDARMQALVHRDHEPITPFVDRVRELHQRLGVSTVLVMGGCGDYFDVADHVIEMHAFLPEDATERAREVARRIPSGRRVEVREPFPAVRARCPQPGSFDASRGRREVRIDARDLDRIVYGREEIDLRGVEQLVDRSQTRAIGHAIHLADRELVDGRRPLAEILDRLEAWMDERGLECLSPWAQDGAHPGALARPRRFEIAAAINRLRSLRMRIAREGAPARAAGG